MLIRRRLLCVHGRPCVCLVLHPESQSLMPPCLLTISDVIDTVRARHGIHVSALNRVEVETGALPDAYEDFIREFLNDRPLKLERRADVHEHLAAVTLIERL